MVEWNAVNIAKPDQLRKDVDAALHELDVAVEDADPGVSAIVESIRKHMKLLEIFHSDHNDDDRIDLFEQQRLRLQIAIQPRMGGVSTGDSLHSATGSGKLSINELSAGSGSRGSHLSQSQSRRSVFTKSSQGLQSGGVASTSNSNSKSGRGSKDSKEAGLVVSPGRVFSASGMRPRLHQSKPGSSALEDDNSDKVVEGITYLTTNMPGYYIRQDAPQIGASDKFIDFQIILTPDELNTLIQRKKALLRMNGGINSATTGTPNKLSVQASTPYIDPGRTIEYRPVQQDKWVGKK